MADAEDSQEKIMHIPQSIVKGEHYEIKIENVYDPSKFWIIVKFRELAIFMKYLKSFYDNSVNRTSIQQDILKKNLMCIVKRSDMYYRSLVLPVLLPDKKVRVFMLDFGFIVNVPADNIFQIFEKHCDVPRFSIRASLAYISPLNQSKFWNQEELKSFCEILEKKTVFAKVCEIDIKQNALHIELFVLNGLISKSVNDILVNLKLAVYNNHSRSRSVEVSKYKCKVKYPHLFPSFEALESGIVPCSLWESDLLKHSVPLDLLYKNYFVYQD